MFTSMWISGFLVKFSDDESFLLFVGGRRMSERDMTRVGNDSKPNPSGPQLLNSKSVPTLHHIGKSLTAFRARERSF